MSNSITQTSGSLAQLLGQKPQKNPSDLTGLLNAQQKMDEQSQKIQQQFAAPADQFLPSKQGIQAAAMSEKYQNAYAYSETLSLELTTQEGDKVKVDFRQLYAQYQEYQHTQGQLKTGKGDSSADQGPQGVVQFDSKQALEASSFEQKFAFSVEGDLNKDELKAVFDVFEQVDSLANQFYDGDVEKAFAQAQNMDIDFGQLKNVNLELHKTQTQVTSYQQVAAYQTVQQQTDPGQQKVDAEAPATSVASLPDYLQKWVDAIDTLNAHFEDARNTFDQLMSGTLAQRFPEQGSQSDWFSRVQGLHDKLAEMANLDKATLKPSGVEISTKVPEQKTAENSRK